MMMMMMAPPYHWLRVYFEVFVPEVLVGQLHTLGLVDLLLANTIASLPIEIFHSYFSMLAILPFQVLLLRKVTSMVHHH